MSEQRAMSIDDLVALNDHWQRRAVKSEAELAYALNQLVKAQKAFNGTALMMRGVDSWPHAESIVGHVDAQALRELRAALTDDQGTSPK